MRISSALAVLAGLSVTTYLFVATGPAVVIGLLFDASYGVAVVIAFHVSQILFDALAWRALLGAVVRPRLRIFMVLRWIREATNNLLPVAQIGGEVVAARLLSLFGVGMAEAAASTAIDLTLEMLSQIGFTMFGIAVLMSFGPRSTPLWQATTCALIGLSALGFGFVAAQWAGLFQVIEQGLLRIGSRFGWRSLEQVAGLHRAVIEIWRAPRAVLVRRAASGLVAAGRGGGDAGLPLPGPRRQPAAGDRLGKPQSSDEIGGLRDTRGPRAYRKAGCCCLHRCAGCRRATRWRYRFLSGCAKWSWACRR